MGCHPNKQKRKDYSPYLNYFNKRSSQGKYMMRELALSDLKEDAYLHLVKQLKGVDDKADEETLKKQIMDIYNDDTYIILIWTFPAPKYYIVASATLHFQKSIGDKFAKSAHLSHVVVDQDHHGKGLGKSLQEALTLMAFREENVNKLIDDTEFVQDNKAHKIITKEDFELQFADYSIGAEPKEIRFLDHRTLVVSLNSFVKYDESKRGDKQYLVSCSLDPNLKVWDLELNTCLQTIDSTHTKTITTSLFLKRDADFQILTCSMDQTIQLIDIEEGTLVGTFFGHKDSVTCLLQASNVFDFDSFLSGSEDCTIKAWKFESSDPVFEINVGSPIKSMVGLRDLNENVKFTVFVGLGNGKIAVFDILTQKSVPLFTLVHTEKNSEYVSCLETFKSNDTWFVLSGCSDGSIKVWNASKGDLVRTYQETTHIITCLTSAVIKGKNVFISGSLDEKNGEVKLWSLEEDQSFKTIKNHGFGVKAMCYLEKYEYLAVSWNNGFRILKLNKELA